LSGMDFNISKESPCITCSVTVAPPVNAKKATPKTPEGILSAACMSGRHYTFSFVVVSMYFTSPS
jgi:hypothetical protein